MKNMFRAVNISVMMFVTAIFCGCSGAHNGVASDVVGDTVTTEANLLTMTDFGDSIIADVTNPWDTAHRLARYVLVPRNIDVLPTVPDGIVVRTPVESSLVYSGVHAGIIDELGAVKAVTGVCDAEYFKTPYIVSGLENGSVIDVGNSMSPSIEQIISLAPEVILLSPFQNAGHGAVESLKMPIIECADYMENTPLGRAEWIKLIGALYGKRAEADSIFNCVKAEYDSLKMKTLALSYLPTVITEQVIDGVWFVPGGKSYMARIITDAGAVYPWSDDNSSGSIQLDFSAVYDKAHDADIWLIRNYGSDLTLDGLKSNYPLNAKFKAFVTGGVYACNTAVSPLFDEFPFHPERLLREYINIFHPSFLQDNNKLRYFLPVK